MSKKEKRKRKPIKHKKLFTFLSILLFIVSIILIVYIYKMNVLGLKYFLIASGALLIIDLIFSFIYLKRFKMKLKIVFVILGIIFMAAEIFGIYNINQTAKFVEKIVSATVKEEIYNIYALSDSKYESSKDLVEKNLGIFDNKNETLNDAMGELKKKVSKNFKKEKYYDDIEELLKAGINKKEDGLFITSTMDQIMREEYPDLINKFKIIDTVTVSYKEKIKKSNINVTKDPFILYISGIDTYGSISTLSRSDVNILAVINPKTGKILLVNTPRDYYVMLHSKKAYDKLTHAGIYGIKESMNTIEDIYNIDIDFYIKVNFSSLIKLVDAIGGIDVDVRYSCAYEGIRVNKGHQHLDGKEALTFARCRKELPEGDITRGENQEEVIRALVEKLSSASIISKYATILNTMSNSFVTNMDKDDIYKLAKYQLNKKPTWEISQANASGTGAYKPTYSAGRTNLYVMMPDNDSINSIKSSIYAIQ